MNNESPLVPQGSFLEQKNQGRNRVKIAVFVVLAIHGIGLMALLMQGCQKAPDTQSGTEAVIDTNTLPVAPTFVEQTNIAPPPVELPIVATESNPPVEPPPVIPNIEVPPVTPAQGTQHTIVAGDTLSKLAGQYKVSVKAIQAANPGLDPNRLQINKVIQIPAPVAGVPPAVAPLTESASNGGLTHKVQSGDTLIRIASKYGVSVKAIRSANGLRTDQIRVNQVLKIPAKNGGSGTATNS